MLYYYHLLRFRFYNKIHIRNRENLDKSWKKVLETRRRLRVVSGQKPMIEKIKDYTFKN